MEIMSKGGPKIIESTDLFPEKLRTFAEKQNSGCKFEDVLNLHIFLFPTLFSIRLFLPFQISFRFLQRASIMLLRSQVTVLRITRSIHLELISF